MTDYKRKLPKTAQTYKIPSDVLSDVDLLVDQKLDILSRWKYDVIAEEVAENEAGMLVRKPELLDQLLRALHALDTRCINTITPLPK